MDQLQLNKTAPEGTPEWKRIMDTELFKFTIPCVMGCCVPNMMQGYAAYKVSNNMVDFAIVCCFSPCVCCFYRTSNKKAVGADMEGDSILMNCLLYYFCCCFTSGQEFRAVEAWLIGGAPGAEAARAASPSAMVMA